MIHPSPRWRYVQEVSDRGLFEEEIVQHHVIEFRALRRSFSEKFCTDDVAVREVENQMRSAARCNATFLPIVFATEVVHGRLTIIMELMQGKPLADSVGRGEFQKPKDWSEFALHFIDNLLEARQAGARFDRLDFSQLMMLPTEDVCSITRFPVGRVTPEVLESSPILRRLWAVQAGGVYTATEPPDEAAELAAIREILVKAAAGNTRSSFEDLRAEAASNPRMYHSPLAHVEKEVAPILIRLSSEAQNATGGPILRLDVLRDLVATLREESTIKRSFVPPPEPPPPPSPAHRPASSQPEPIAQRPVGESLYGGGEIKPDPPSSPRREITPPPPTVTQSKKAANSAVPEDSNPYASEEETAGTARAGAKEPAAKAPRMISTGPGKPIVKYVAIAVAALAVIVAAAVVLPPLFSKPVPNLRPVAVVAAQQDPTHKLNQEILIDSSGSHDPEGAAVTFYWELISPADGTVVFTDPSSKRSSNRRTFVISSPKLVVQFQSRGKNVLELKVNDGTQFSEPVRLEFEVTSAQ